MPICELIEVISTIDAGLLKTGKSAWIRKNGPLKLMLSERSKALSSHFSSGAISAIPALMKRISSRPNSLRIVSATCFWPDAFPASDAITSTRLSPSSLRAASRVCSSLPVIATRAPSSRNCRAVSSPMPLVPPVIRAFLFFSRFMFTLFIFQKVPISTGRIGNPVKG